MSGRAGLEGGCPPGLLFWAGSWAVGGGGAGEVPSGGLRSREGALGGGAEAGARGEIFCIAI